MTASYYIANESSRGRLNWKIYELYVSHQMNECEKLIEDQLYLCKGQCLYAIYIEGLMERNVGNISESLELFQACVALEPNNLSSHSLKQVARSLFLLGKYKSAIEIYNTIDDDSWDVYYNRGLCLQQMKEFESAVDNYQNANAIQRHDSTFMRIADIYLCRSTDTSDTNMEMAIDTYKEALEFSPESSCILTKLGLLYLQMNDEFSAFNILGSSLSLDPTNALTILAVGSMMQEHGDMDVALVKYRISAVRTPESSALWNNIGMCFYCKGKYTLSKAALRRALYLSPFNSYIAYNAGLLFLSTQQYLSAFMHLSKSAAINNQKYSSSDISSCFSTNHSRIFLYLAVALSEMKDFDNSCIAIEKAFQLNDKKKKKEKLEIRPKCDIVDECLLHINYCIILLKRINEEFHEIFSNENCQKTISFSFSKNALPTDFMDNVDDEEEQEYYSYIFEQMSKHKSTAFEHWMKLKNIWVGINQEIKDSQLEEANKQYQILQHIFVT